jgi:hypothetical protein
LWKHVGFLEKAAGSRKTRGGCSRFWGKILPVYNQRLFVLTADGLAYINPTKRDAKTGGFQIVDFVMFDREFSVDLGSVDMGQMVSSVDLGIGIHNISRNMGLKAYCEFDLLVFACALTKTMNESQFICPTR